MRTAIGKRRCLLQRADLEPAERLDDLEDVAGRDAVARGGVTIDDSICSTGCPVTCSTVTSVAPGIFFSSASISRAFLQQRRGRRRRA
jgi:hypothetical protein